MHENFRECIQDYPEVLAGFCNVGDQLIHWLHTVKKPALMPVHDFMRRQVQLMTYLEDGQLCRTMALPGNQEKIEQVFFLLSTLSLAKVCQDTQVAFDGCRDTRLLFRAVT